MTYDSIVISSGHGLYVRGASGILDEVDEARLVVEALADELRTRRVEVVTYHDDVSRSQGENLDRIVDFHNSNIRDLDISVHFNAYEQVSKPMGVEVLYLSQSALAADLSEAISDAGELINRGAKKRTDLAVLNNTDGPCVLLEVCFVDSSVDADLYRDNFLDIVRAIADVLTADAEDEFMPPPEADRAFHAIGTCSYFGGPEDDGVSADEGLALYSDVMEQPCLFLPYQPDNTTGLARRLNPFIHYVACRWDYDETPKSMLQEEVALVKSLKHGTFLTAFPADWGPNSNTGRVADLSPGLMKDLGITTDDEVEVIFPYDPEE